MLCPKCKKKELKYKEEMGDTVIYCEACGAEWFGN